MSTSNYSDIYSSTLSEDEFDRLSDLIYQRYGMKMPRSKKLMLEGRLYKRLRENNMTNFKDYCEMIFDDQRNADEMVHMIDVVTTNKTDFYRESVHFEYMTQTVLPRFAAAGHKFLRLWSAGCSTGEEPYTVSVVLSEFKEAHPSFDYSLDATDLSTRVLKHGIRAVYTADRISVIPLELKRKYFLKSKDPGKTDVRVCKELRAKVNFSRLNFMDSKYDVYDSYDIVFCRNVIIYFDKATQQMVLERICRHIKTGGTLFLGHSESINELDLPLK